ncbi:MAG: hypothetical protein R3244_00880 [Thermoanaerobaculia bacterium]|nr:hypothetical protein [Thermoanaerobaculia bacterium]
MRLSSICSLLVLAAAPLTAGGDCRASRPLTLELDADGAGALEIVARAGDLVVEGDDTATTVSVEATACASSEPLLERIRLDSGRRGDRLWIEADLPESYLGWRGSSRLDLVVTVPSRLALRIDDGSGAIDLRGIGALDLEDGSGEIEIDGVRGPLRVEDGSGEIRIRDVGGDLVLRDGSGSIRLRDIEGDVRIAEDGSGEIEIDGVRGGVEIGDDGSGGIRIRDVTGTVAIGADGSGSISVARIGGDFLLRSDGSGSVHVEEVAGVVETP